MSILNYNIPSSFTTHLPALLTAKHPLQYRQMTTTLDMMF